MSIDAWQINVFKLGKKPGTKNSPETGGGKTPLSLGPAEHLAGQAGSAGVAAVSALPALLDRRGGGREADDGQSDEEAEGKPHADG